MALGRKIRQRHGALGAALGEAKRCDEIFGRRRRQRLPEGEDACRRDQRLQQQVLDEAGRLQPPALTAGQFRLRVVRLVHSRIKPC
jgi:hypothetical protein